MHVVLLGDSTLDNAAYTAGGPSVIEHLTSGLSHDGTATLLAMDGAMLEDVSHQLRHVPEEATHVVLSAGGNDAMMRVELLTTACPRVWEALTAVANVVDEFATSYRDCLRRVLRLDLPTTVCTIYNGAFDEASGEQRVVSTALRVFNDAILQLALDHDLPVIDLRRVCSRRSDFANPIEPNVEGGRKIAAAIQTALRLDPSPAPFLVPSARHEL